jgi:hypothetical protein
MIPCTRSPASPLAAIESMHGTLVLARAFVESGRRIDLAGLDAAATALCAAVAMLPPADARALRPALVALLEEVDGLRAALSPAP